MIEKITEIQKIKQKNTLQSIGGHIDIFIRDMVLFTTDLIFKSFDYPKYNSEKITKKLSELLSWNSYHFLDRKLGYIVIDRRIFCIDFGISGQKYISPINNIYIGNERKNYISISNKSDNLYNIKLKNSKEMIYEYKNGKFMEYGSALPK